MISKLRAIPWSLFAMPTLLIAGILGYLITFHQLHMVLAANMLIWAVILVGSLELIRDTLDALIHKKFALDYIAILAIITGLLTQNYLVAAIIILMLAGGTGLEKYGMLTARKSLTALTNRIPHDVHLYKKGIADKKVAIESVRVGEGILVRRGEVIPLDGHLISKHAWVDESSLTGEPYMMDKVAGDAVRSGTVNSGDVIAVKVDRADADSTYRKIIAMVQKAQEEKSPLIRIADHYSGVFTGVTLALCLFAFLLSHDLTRVLAVLVVATPCPLILATPIALMGGMNAAAKKRIILKRLSAIEVLSRVQALILDKTGTLTLGKPVIKDVQLFAKDLTKEHALRLAAAIERNSLHPLAKAIVEAAKAADHDSIPAREVREIIGQGISGVVDGKKYLLRRPSDSEGMGIELVSGDRRLALFHFEDEIKKDAAKILRNLIAHGLRLLLYTGDKEARAREMVAELGITIEIKSECSPADKQEGITTLKKQGLVTAMVGDGINDAPALAASDVGMVFSNEEQTASSEAADVVFLGGDLELVTQAIAIAKRTMRVAKESIFIGIGLSILGMILGATGILPPIWGAAGQEAIDVAVILNALRASRFKEMNE
jgi:heavy metal translocating P-type ATPase